MTKKNLKKFMKDHKMEIIAGTVAIIGIGSAALGAHCVKSSNKKHALSWIEDNKIFMDLFKTVDEACVGCTDYARITLPEIAAMVDKDGNVMDHIFVDPNGKLFEVKNLIAFGNEVKM